LVLCRSAPEGGMASGNAARQGLRCNRALFVAARGGEYSMPGFRAAKMRQSDHLSQIEINSGREAD